MRTQFKNSVLTVVTGITEETVKKGISDLVARDEKGNAKYMVKVSTDGRASLDTNGIVCNTFIDGKAAVVMVLPAAVTLADVQKQYGEALIAADQYTAAIALAADNKVAQIESLFSEDAE